MILAAIIPGRVLEASSVSHIAIAQESAYVICSEKNASAAAAAAAEQLSGENCLGWVYSILLSMR